MTWIMRVSMFCKMIAMCVLAYVFLILELSVISIFLLGFTLFSISINWHKKIWISNLGFILCVLLAGVALKLGSNIFLMFIAVLLGLIAWDLDDFGRRISSTQNILHKDQIIKNHLILLGCAVISGAVLAFISTVIRIQLSIEIGIALVVFGVLGLLLGIRVALERI